MSEMAPRADDGPPIRVWLELDLDAQPIEGTLMAWGGRQAEFRGWLGLTAELEGLRREVARSGDPAAASGEP